jgi:hypothetical protein
MERKTLPNNFFKESEVLLGILTLCATHAQGQEGSIGKLGNIIGKAEIVRGGKNISAAKGMDVFTTDVLVTSPKTAVKIQFIDGSTFMAFENASIKIEEYKVQANGNSVSLKSAINVVKGKVRFFVKPKPNGSNDSTFKTPNAVMGIRGTSGFIDTTIPGKTQLVVLTGKVEIRNPQAPQIPVMVGANQMTDVVGRQNPTLPKEAPASLLSNLNSDATNVDQGRPPAQGSDSQKESGDGKGEEKKDDSKKDDSKKEESKQDDSKKDDAKKDDAKKDDAKKDEPKKDDSKKDDAKKDDAKKDEPKKDDSKKDEPKKDDAKKDEPKKSEPKKDDAKKDDSKNSEPKGKKESGDGNANSDKKDSKPAGNKDSGAPPKKSDDAPPSRTENKESPSSSQQQNANSRGEKPSGLAQDGNSQAATPKDTKQELAPPPPSAKPAPVNVERKTVFTPEGTTVVSVKDQNLQSMTVPVAGGIGPVSSQMSSKTQAAGGESAAPAKPAPIQVEAYKPPDVLREVSKVTEVNKTVEQTVTTVTQPVQQAVKQDVLPAKKNVKIKVTLPQ